MNRILYALIFSTLLLLLLVVISNNAYALNPEIPKILETPEKLIGNITEQEKQKWVPKLLVLEDEQEEVTEEAQMPEPTEVLEETEPTEQETEIEDTQPV